MFELIDIIEIAAYMLIASSFGGGAYFSWWLLRGVYHIDEKLEAFKMRRCEHEYTKCWKCGHRKGK
jgi:hypothetical protein